METNTEAEKLMLLEELAHLLNKVAETVEQLATHKIFYEVKISLKEKNI